jgi:hypothetical protein
MGRNRKYNTEEERIKNRKEYRMKYYWEHVEHEREQNLKNYYKRKSLKNEND